MTIIVALVAFASMEPLAALAHRCVMHGGGWRWHRSHHRRLHSGWEANDLYPAVLASLTIASMAVGVAVHSRVAVAMSLGVTAYGAAYAMAHDVCTHGRLSRGRRQARGRWLRWVAACHDVHHATGGAPYGFLVPIVPARHRAAVAVFRTGDTRARREKTS